MSNKISIVISAADSCGKPSSIRSMDHLPSRDHKGAEHKESFMLSNRSSISRGCLLAATSLVVAMLGTMTSAVSASIVYQDSFTGGTANLDGAAPSVDHGTSTVWTAGATSGPGNGAGAGVGWFDNGSTSLSGNSGGAYLSFTPVNGNIYTLTTGIDPTAGNWLAIGFVKTPNTINPLNGSGAYAWVLISPGGGGQIFTGPDTSNANGGFTGTSSVNTVSIVLNTQAAAWTYQVFDNAVAAEASPVVFSTNPTITAVGLGNSSATGTFSNFELSSAAVPEPPSLGLVAVGGLGLLLLKRRKAV